MSMQQRVWEMSGLMPGGYCRSALVVGPESPHLVKGHGCYVVDEDGRTLIDMNNDFTALVHGNSHPALVKASQDALADGSAFGMPTWYEDEHAQILVDRIPGVDQIRYTCSGTEAVMTAIRLARAVTGRMGLLALRGAYHGFADTIIATGGPAAHQGVPQGLLDELTLVDCNDIAGLEAAVAERGEQLAAIVIDILPNQAGLISVTKEFLQRVRELCDQHGILFIDDEVINLRAGFNGIAAERGVRPDVVVVGKLIGGGHPAGAVMANREIMGRFDPAGSNPLKHGGTFAANPLMLRTGAEALRLLDEDAIARLNRLGQRARDTLSNGIKALGWTVRGEASVLRPFPPSDIPAGPAQKRLFWAAYEREVAVPPTALCALSTPMDEQVVDSAMERLIDAIEEVDSASRKAAEVAQ